MDDERTETVEPGEADELQFRLEACVAERDWLRMRVKGLEAALRATAPGRAPRVPPCADCGGEGRADGFCWTCHGSGMALSWTHHQRWHAAQEATETLWRRLDDIRSTLRHLRDGPPHLLAFAAS